jgi:uncharacterized membrane protein YagU involved in acid resistance
MNNLTHRIATGALAGLAATAPMTAAMELMHRWLPWRQQHALPPRTITMRTLHKIGIGVPNDEAERLAATLVSHFGYGASAGAIYGLAAPEIPAPHAVKGVGYGLLVWAGSYLGLLPALGLMSTATRQPAERNTLMIVAHVIWGAALGLMTERLQQKPPLAGRIHSPRKSAPRARTAGKE